MSEENKNVLPDGIKEAIGAFVDCEDIEDQDMEVLTSALKELKEDKGVLAHVKDSIARVISFLDEKDVDSAKTELQKLLGANPSPEAIPEPEADEPKGQEEPAQEETESAPLEKFLFHMQIKSIREEEDSRVIEGYASVTGVVDRDGEVMDEKAFNKGLSAFLKNNPILLLNHDKDKPIGQIASAHVDNVGLWVKAKIADGSQVADEAWNLIKQKVLRSFSVGGLFERKGNILTRWDLTEISVVAVPANQRAVFSVAKAFETGSDLVDTEIQKLIEDLEEEKKKFYLPSSVKFIDECISQLCDTRESGITDAESKAKELYDVCVKEVTNKVEDEKKAIIAAVKEELEHEAQQKAWDTLVAEDHDKNVAAEAIKTYKESVKGSAAKNSLEFPTDEEESEEGESGKMGEVHTKYDGCEMEDLTFAKMFMDAAKIQYTKDLGIALNQGAKEFVSTKEGRKFLADEGLKSNELMSTDPGSATPNTGEDWIPTLEANTLWAKIQLSAKVAPLFKSINMPSNPYHFPIDSGGPTIYTVPEAEDAGDIEADAATFTKSTVASGKVVFDAKKMGALTYFSEELIEDSIIPILPTLKNDFYDAMTRGLDRVLISGDEATGGSNYSYKGSSATAKMWMMTCDGLRDQAFTNSDTADVGALTYDDIRTVQALMGQSGKFGVTTSDLALICDPATYLRLEDLDEVITVDKFGSRATILTGQLAGIKGIPIIVSEEFDPTDATGYVEDAPADGTKGSFLVVNRKGIMLGYRRRLSMTVATVPYSDLRYMVASMRFDIQFRQAGMVGYGFNVTI